MSDTAEIITDPTDARFPHGEQLGYSRGCKCDPCRKAHSDRAALYRERLAQRSKEQILVDQQRLRPDGLKTCRQCREAKPITEYHVNRSRGDGLQEFCHDCFRSARTVLVQMAGLGWKLQPGSTRTVACAYKCGRPATSLDHYQPVRHGGSNELDNLVPCCNRCNSAKKDMDPKVFLRQQGLRSIAWPLAIRIRRLKTATTRRSR